MPRLPTSGLSWALLDDLVKASPAGSRAASWATLPVAGDAGLSARAPSWATLPAPPAASDSGTSWEFSSLPRFGAADEQPPPPQRALPPQGFAWPAAPAAAPGLWALRRDGVSVAGGARASCLASGGAQLPPRTLADETGSGARALAWAPQHVRAPADGGEGMREKAGEAVARRAPVAMPWAPAALWTSA